MASLEERTSDTIGSDLLNFNRMRTIVRLEVRLAGGRRVRFLFAHAMRQIGIFNLGTQFTAVDLTKIVTELHSLRALKLYFCHLVRADAFRSCMGSE